MCDHKTVAFISNNLPYYTFSFILQRLIMMI